MGWWIRPGPRRNHVVGKVDLTEIITGLWYFNELVKVKQPDPCPVHRTPCPKLSGYQLRSRPAPQANTHALRVC